MKPRFAFGLAVVCAAVVVACGDGGDERPPTGAQQTATRTSGAELEEARAAAEEALLRLEDFPTGWVERPAEEDEEDFEADLPPECQWFIEQEELPGTVVEVESREFHGPDDEEVESSVTIFEDVAAASQTFADVSDFIERCRQPLREAVAQYFQDKIREEGEELPFEDIELSDFNMDRLSFPAYGDEGMALRMSFTIDTDFLSADFYMDIFGIRVDRIVGGMSFGQSFEIPDTNEEERLAGIIEERLHTVVAQSTQRATPGPSRAAVATPTAGPSTPQPAPTPIPLEVLLGQAKASVQERGYDFGDFAFIVDQQGRRVLALSSVCPFPPGLDISMLANPGFPCSTTHFLLEDQYLGTDTFYTYLGSEHLIASDPNQFIISYQTYAPGDPRCCPSVWGAVVYTWDGQRLNASGEPPRPFGKPFSETGTPTYLEGWRGWAKANGWNGTR
jgi:hypothetical protein